MWQTQHLRHWAGSGGAFGSRLTPWLVAVGVGVIGMVLGDIHSYFYLENMIFGDIDP